MPNSSLKAFLKSDASVGLFLITAAALAIMVANSNWQSFYQFLLHTKAFGVTLAHLVNDGLMAIFFLSIGLEVKEELIEGSLKSKQAAIFPFIAAVGGMLAPALIYLLLNLDDPLTLQGWAIPAATDIAFALGILALVGSAVPTGLKAFLLALAIIDDLGVIVIIALFYTNSLSTIALLIALCMTLILCFLNYKNVDKLWPYLVVGFVLWASVLQSGVHATLAGVVLGFAIPLYALPAHKRKSSQQKTSESDPSDKPYSPLKTLHHRLTPWVNFCILPLFAFANAGVVLEGLSFSDVFAPVPLGVALGLILGKPLGVVSFSLLAVKLGVANLPKGVSFKHIFAISGLCGIGFTMSIFIASLAFSGQENDYENLARLGILSGSILSAIFGYIALKWSLKK